MRLDPYRLKPVPVETPSGHLKTSSVWKLTWKGVHVDHCGSIPNSWICPTEACDEFYIIICIFTRINCKSSRNQLLRTKRCVSVFAKRWCTCTLTSNSPHLTAANFLWGYLKAQVFTHTLPHINSLKNAIRQEIAKVTQDTLRRVMASVPGIVPALIVMVDISKTLYWRREASLWIQDTDPLNRVQLYLLLGTINVLSYFQNG